MKNELYIGIDVSKDFFDAAVAPKDAGIETWAVLPRRHFELAHNDPKAKEAIKKWLEEAAKDPKAVKLVVMESTGAYSRRLAENLKPWLAAIVNPNRARKFGQSLGNRGKSDPIDAATLALFAARRQPKPAPEPTKTEKKLRQLTRLREQITESATEWKNRLTQIDLKDIRREVGKIIAQLQKRIDQVDKQIEKTAEKDQRLGFQFKALQQIPGIKKVVAAALTAEFGDLTAYARNQLAAAAGLNPIPNESGRMKKPSRLAKGGGKHARRALHMSARSLFRCKGPLGDHIRHLESKGMTKACILGVMMRKLLLVARAVMKNGGVYDPNKIKFQGANAI